MAFEYTFRGADMPELDPKVRDLLENRDQELELYLSTLSGGGSGSSPSGSLTAFAGATAPTGWLICDGDQYPQASYASLYAIIGNTYNTGGETAGYFRVPNIKGRVIVGRDASDSDFNVLGETSGAKTHTLTESEMPSHDHTGSISGGSHFHSMNTGAALTLGAGNSLFANSGNPPVTSAGSTGTSTSHSHTLNINNAGSGNAHNNLQPYIALNWIIKT
jgi:microcystin-dependent protein